MGGPLEPGRVRLRDVSRSYRLVHERNLTLKETLLRRKRLRATQLWALRNVNLDASPGESVGIIGQNGAGKSTLLKLVARIIPPQTGTVETGGAVASMLELGAGFHPDFTGRENVYLNGSILGLSDREIRARMDEIVAFAELAAFIDAPVKTYSSGMYMRLAFSIASHVNPDVLLLDEVLAVGDESFQRKCLARIFDYRRRGGTLLYVSHDPNSVELICDRAVLLSDGEIVADGPPADVLATYHRRLAGGSHAAPTEGAAATAAPTGEGEGDARSWGNRRITIRSSRLLGPDGPADRFVSGDPFIVEMEVDAAEPSDWADFGLIIHTVEGVLCYGTHTRSEGLSLQRLDGPMTVRFRVPTLGLHEGRFVVTLAVSVDGEICHWLDRWLEFTVFQRASGVGPVDLSGEWTVAPARAGPADLAGRSRSGLAR